MKNKFNNLQIFAFFLLSFCLYAAMGQFPSKPGITILEPKKKDTVLTWSTTPLTWNDYRKIKDTTLMLKVGSATIKAKAATTTTIISSFICTGNELSYSVKAIFSLKNSWILEKAKGDSDIIRHEQVHFDITELYARKIRKLLAEYVNPCGKEKEIKSKVNLLKQAERNENNLYDAQTVHSTNKPMQKKWETKVINELKETEQYINPSGINMKKKG